MKSREEVEAILNDPQAEQKLDMLKVLLDGQFTREELACMFTGVVQLFVPMMNAEAFKSYCDTMRTTFNNTEAELVLVEEKKVYTLSREELSMLDREEFMARTGQPYPTPITDALCDFFGKDMRYEVKRMKRVIGKDAYEITIED